MVSKAEHAEQVIYADLGECITLSFYSLHDLFGQLNNFTPKPTFITFVSDPQLVEDIRQQIPVSRQKRTDMYDLKDVSSL